MRYGHSLLTERRRGGGHLLFTENGGTMTQGVRSRSKRLKNATTLLLRYVRLSSAPRT